MGKKGLGSKPYETPKCKLCNQTYKNYKFIGGSVIKDICNCNKDLLDKEAERILEKRKSHNG